MILDGRSALVTGASGPIGRAIADLLAENGARVVLHYRTTPPENTGKNMASVPADLTLAGFEEALLAQAREMAGPLDILVNCAAEQALQGFSNPPDGGIARLLRINVTAVDVLSRAFVRQVPASARSAAILNISSIEAQLPAAGHAQYAASKAALDSLTLSLAREFGPKGIRTNGIAPGLIDREGLEDAWPEGVARWKKHCPAGRLGTPRDVAAAALFLVSEDAAWINGATLRVDGGMLATGIF